MSLETRAVLQFRNVRIRFGAVVALDLPELDLFADGRLAVLLGSNGAGKSTLINAATGYAQTGRSCRITLVNGKRTELVGLSRDRIVRRGVARTFQSPACFQSLTVEEAMLLTAGYCTTYGPCRRVASLFRSPGGDRHVRLLVDALIDELGLGPVARTRMSELPFVTLRRAELARTLAGQPAVLFIDEPSAGADRAEVAFLLDLLCGRLPKIVTSLAQLGLYCQNSPLIGLVTHDRMLLDGLVQRSTPEPTAHFFEAGRLQSTGPLKQWLASGART